jgi:hypothetical protein
MDAFEHVQSCRIGALHQMRWPGQASCRNFPQSRLADWCGFQLLATGGAEARGFIRSRFFPGRLVGTFNRLSPVTLQAARTCSW